MTKDLSQMTYAELVELTRQAESMMKEQRAEALEAVVAQIKDLAEANKLSLDDIIAKLGGSKPANAKADQKSNVKPQFAHPENPSLTWSGRGRTPVWVLEYVGTDKLDRLDTDHQAKLDEIRV
jgi:DNA-binding protein H-NS